MKRSMFFCKFACRMFSRRALIFSISRISGENILEVSGREGEAGTAEVASLEMDELSSVFLYLDSSDSVTEVAGCAGGRELGITWLVTSFEAAILGSNGFVIKWE